MPLTTFDPVTPFPQSHENPNFSGVGPSQQFGPGVVVVDEVVVVVDEVVVVVEVVVVEVVPPQGCHITSHVSSPSLVGGAHSQGLHSLMSKSHELPFHLYLQRLQGAGVLLVVDPVPVVVVSQLQLSVPPLQGTDIGAHSSPRSLGATQ